MFTINRLATFLLLVVFLTNTFVYQIHPATSSYSPFLRFLDCNNLDPLRGCRHEVGHKMDHDLGLPSHTAEFAIATQAIVQYMWLTLEPNDMALFISVYPDKRPHELYAGIYSYVEGDISKLPESLQPFFSNDQSYLNLYDCLAQKGLNICDRSVSFLRGDSQ